MVWDCKSLLFLDVLCLANVVTALSSNGVFHI